MKVEAYLNFDGRCEEALDFYKTAIGAEAQIMRFGESPEAPPGGHVPGTEKKILHAMVKIGNSFVMASDGHNQGKPKFEGIMLSLTVASVAEADRYFKALAKGGQETLPLSKTFFSERFGMLIDKFGVSWMVITVPGA